MTNEVHEMFHVALIGRLKRVNIGSASFADLLQIVTTSPINRLCFVDAGQNGIRHDARVSTVAIRKWMDLKKSMVKSNRRL